VAVFVLDGTLEALADTPTLTLKVQRGTRQAYDGPGMVALLAPYGSHQAHVLIEESQPMPGQGTPSMCTIGYGFGLWRGLLTTLQIPYRTSGRIQTENYGCKVFATSLALLNGFSGHFAGQLDPICNLRSLFYGHTTYCRTKCYV
jgi:hypothetical protein